MTLREIAAKALAERQFQEAKDAEEAFKRVFHVEPESVNVEAGTITHEGLTFRYWKTCENEDRFEMQGKCPDCGEETWSGFIEDLADLGEQLVKFDPYFHDCPKSN